MSAVDRPGAPRPTVERPVAVVGATGQQGGAVARALLDRGTPIRAIVRDPDAERARALIAAGAEVVVADLDDVSSLRAAFDGASAVFAMASPTPDGGVQAEAQHGKAIARAVGAVAVGHVVYSSVGGVERDSGIPHFESKLEIEQTLLDVGVPCTFIRPVFFMDNFVRFRAPVEEDGTIMVRLPMPGDVSLQMIAVVDVAAISVVALLKPARVPGGAIEIAGDELTGEQITASYGERRGLPARFEHLPTAVLDADNRAMFEWLANPPAYQADLAATRQLDPRALTFRQWLKTVA